MSNTPALQSVPVTSTLARTLAAAGTRILRCFPPEPAHEFALWCMKTGISRMFPTLPGLPTDVSLKVSCDRLGTFAHPVGLAAGFDKNACSLKGLSNLGFSSIEIGTVTPKPQKGNPRPRLFRQTSQRALINRMGFNNLGCKKISENLLRSSGLIQESCLGINVGKNRATESRDAVGDYCTAIRALADKGAGYFVINVSSPNTPGLRDLVSRDFLEELAASLRAERDTGTEDVWIKLDPDRGKQNFQELVGSVAEAGFAGLVLTNTHRVDLPQKGGQSGHPLAIESTRCLEWAWEVHKGGLPMIGCGGILSGSDIYQKIIRGASLVQIYTALIYRGPYVVSLLLEELAQELRLRNIRFLGDLTGSYYQDPPLGRKG